MDYQKKKLLTQSVAFLQANLSLTPGLLDAFKVSGILTSDEVKEIQKDEMTSGKVLELICIMKRKDNRTFSRFVEVLDKNNCTAAANVLKHKSDATKPDPRTVFYLEKSLKSTSVNSKTIEEISVDLVLREIYQDEIRLLQDRLLNLQRSLQSTKKTSRGSTPDSLPSTPGTPPKWDMISTPQELQQLLAEKDALIRRKDTEYGKLRTLLEDTQKHYADVLGLNSQYLTIIGQLNTMHMNGITPRASEKDVQLAELEQKLVEAEEKVFGLSSNLDNITIKLEQRHTEAEKLIKREQKYKELLGLTDEAGQKEVEVKIRELMTEGRMQYEELMRIKQDLKETQSAKENIEEKIGVLSREKDHISFQLRQQDLMIKRMQRQKVAAHTIPAAEHMLTQHSIDGTPVHMKLPSIGRPESQLGLSSRPTGGRQYCVLCRTEFFPLKSPMCRIHFRPLRDHRWSCCRDDCHRSAGCLQVSHYYIEITADKKIFLTDGAKYWELS